MYYGEIENDGGDCLSPVIFPQNGEFQKLHSILVDGGDRFGVSAVTIDLQEELIWMGNQGGHVTSYYGNNMEKYTSFQVHASQEIRQILTCDEVILILTQGQLRGQLRRGLSVFTHSSEQMQEMQCMLLTTPSTVLMGGHQSQLVELDLPTLTQTNIIQLSDAGCAILRSQGRLICTGEATGEIQVYDSRTFRKEQTLEGHSGSLSDFDVHGNLLVTCGFSSRHGNLSVDRFLKVYDLRVLRALAPIPVSIDPFLLRFLPSFSSRIATVSPSGQMEILETQAVSQSNICLYQVTSNASICTSFDVSSSCHQMAFGDSTGSLHLFSSNPSAMFNSFSKETEFPDPVETFPPMSFTDDFVSFASIPLAFTNTPLLSDWPQEYCWKEYRRAPLVDPTIMQSMKMVGTIGYAPNPGTFRRNQMQYKMSESNPNNSTNNNLSHSPTSGHNKNNYYSVKPNNSTYNPTSTSPNPKHQIPQQLSPQHPPPFLYQQHPPGPRPFYHKPAPIYPKNTTFYGGKRPGFHYNKYHIPKRYSRVEWKKNYFEEADMEPFNRTTLAGLEATQANSYCNSILQILYHIDYLRVCLLSHLCEKEACMSCELGFLFHMLDQSKCIPSVASNFLRAFRLVPEASALGLILQESQSKQRGSFLRLIQSFNRFILHQIEAETGKSDTENLNMDTDPISTLFSMRQENINRCTRCGREETKESTVLLSNLLYSPDATGGGKRCRFIELIQRSLCPEQTTPAWCDKCEKYQPTFQSRVPKAFPPFLSFNTCLDNAHDFQTWRNHLESLLPEKGIKPEPPEPQVIPGRPQSSVGPPGHVKSCRYGRNCMRPDCKFWHEGRTPKIEHAKMTEFDLSPESQVKWLPMSLRTLIEDDRRVRCLDTENVENVAPLPEDKIKNGSAADYELISVVCFVRDPDSEERNNLVSLIRVNSPYLERANQIDQKSNWFIFNDFCIREVSEGEAVSFNPKWKIPCVLYYKKKDDQMPTKALNIPNVQETITEDVFKKAEYLGKDGQKNQKATYKPLSSDEIPKKGQLVAMDAEFVTLGQEETELRSDGKLATVKPQQMTVARVTCIRGQGQLEGTPFLDDYISTQEVVVDYLTKFSGIKPGDLDVNFSSKNVTTLKSVYLKLRYLIDSGVKFVGHGLNNDFRVINLVVPPIQVIDTVNLFFIPNQRMISLRFLAWHFLGLSIQSEVHDSTEDARAALLLYRKYEELKKNGNLEKALEGLYEAGKKSQWKVPNESNEK